MNHQTATRGLRFAELATLRTLARITPSALGHMALKRLFANRLVEMRGIPMKMAQALSMSQDQALANLHRSALAKIPRVKGDQLLKRLTTAQNPLLKNIADLSQAGISASLGQVHRAQMKDGRICALKVKHEGIDPAMDMDAGLMEFLVSVFGHFREGFSSEAYRALLAEELRGELDYPYEGRRQALIHRAFKDIPGIVIPRPYPEESGEDFLLMDWEPSTPIEEFAARASEAERLEAGKLLAGFYFRTLFACGLLHADPNPGNLGLRKAGSRLELVIYDFGSVVPMESVMLEGFIELLQGARTGVNPLQTLINMGFTAIPLIAIEKKLAALCAIMLEPFIAGDEYDLGQWNRKNRVVDLLGSERWNFMLAAPPSLFFLMRAFKGLFHYAEILGGKAPIAKVLSQTMADTWKKPLHDTLSKNNSEDLILSRTPAALPNSETTKLRIEVKENGMTKVSLTFPGSAAGRLESLIDPDLAERIASHGLDVSAISRAAETENYKPMRLLHFAYDVKEITIWLE